MKEKKPQYNQALSFGLVQTAVTIESPTIKLNAMITDICILAPVGLVNVSGQETMPYEKCKHNVAVVCRM